MTLYTKFSFVFAFMLLLSLTGIAQYKMGENLFIDAVINKTSPTWQYVGNPESDNFRESTSYFECFIPGHEMEFEGKLMMGIGSYDQKPVFYFVAPCKTVL